MQKKQTALLDKIKNKLKEYRALPKGRRYDISDAVITSEYIVSGEITIDTWGLFSVKRNQLLMSIIATTINVGKYLDNGVKLNELIQDLKNYYEVILRFDKRHLKDHYSDLQSLLYFVTIDSLITEPKSIIKYIDSVKKQSTKNPIVIPLDVILEYVQLYRFNLKRTSKEDLRHERGGTEDRNALLFQLYDFSHILMDMCFQYVSRVSMFLNKSTGTSNGDNALVDQAVIANENFKICVLAYKYYTILLQQRYLKRKSGKNNIEQFGEDNRHLTRACKYSECMCDWRFWFYNDKHSKFISGMELSNPSYLGKDYDKFTARKTSFIDGYFITDVTGNKPANIISGSLRNQLILFVNGILVTYLPLSFDDIKTIAKNYHSPTRTQYRHLHGIIFYDMSYAKELSAEDYCHILDLPKRSGRYIHKNEFTRLQGSIENSKDLSDVTVQHLSNAIQSRWPNCSFFHQTDSEELEYMMQLEPLYRGYNIEYRLNNSFVVSLIFATDFVQCLLKILCKCGSYKKFYSVLHATTKGPKLDTKRDIKIITVFVKYIVKIMYQGTTLFSQNGLDAVFYDEPRAVKNRFISIIETPHLWSIMVPTIVLNHIRKAIKTVDVADINWGDDYEYKPSKNKDTWDIIDGQCGYSDKE